MADGMSAERLQKAIDKHPGYTVVCYINTTADVKVLSDVCVTSSSAVKIINAIDNPDILFIPDCNLGAYVASQVPEKNVALVSGGCPIHAAVTAHDLAAAKSEHPDALVLVHPECVPDVVSRADYVGSTSGIYDYALASDKSEFIIGTEISIAEHLQFAAPEKKFFALTKKLMCHNMKATTLMDVYHCLLGIGGDEIVMAPELIASARKCIDEMIRLGGK
jgi:quinolinate synthase